MTRLSVNINKVALLRNARGGSLPDLVQVARDCEAFGAQGITVHPRPDQRHVRFDDIPALRSVVTTEFNIEGNPTREFLDMVLANPPHQCTLVPDVPDQLTSDAGWDTIRHQAFLREVVAGLHAANIRVSVFVDPAPRMIEGALETGADDIIATAEGYELRCGIHAFDAVAHALEAAKIRPASAEIAYIPTTTVPAPAGAVAKHLAELHESLDALDDVQHVFSNEENA